MSLIARQRRPISIFSISFHVRNSQVPIVILIAINQAGCFPRNVSTFVSARCIWIYRHFLSLLLLSIASLASATRPIRLARWVGIGAPSYGFCRISTLKAPPGKGGMLIVVDTVVRNMNSRSRTPFVITR